MDSSIAFLRRFLLSCVAVAGAGCAMLDDDHEDHWRRLTVIETVRRSDLSDDINSRCIVERTAADDDRVAVVQFRSGRALHAMAFALPRGTLVKAGDRISVNPRLCATK